MIADAKLPEQNHPSLIKAMIVLGCNTAELVKIEPRPNAKVNECHTNVVRQVNWYGGTQVKGYYVAVSETTNEWVAIKHSVWRRGNRLVDVTPVEDNRQHNVFIYGATELHTSVYSNTENEIFVDDTRIYKEVL